MLDMAGAVRPCNVRSALLSWSTPACAALFGIGYLAADAAAGRPGEGVAALVLMLAVGAAFVLASRRSETIRGLMDRRDERIAGIDLRATAATGTLLIVVILVSGMVELARGHSGAPYTWLAAIGGVGYVAALIIGRARH